MKERPVILLRITALLIIVMGYLLFVHDNPRWSWDPWGFLPFISRLTGHDLVHFGYTTAGGDCQINQAFPVKIQQWCPIITAQATAHDLPPDLVAALIWIESAGEARAYSHSGAVGLMQVMPSDGRAAAFMCPQGPCFQDRPTTHQLQDPEFNIAYGTQLLADLVQRKGDLREALKSYGPVNVGYTYADKVLAVLRSYGF